VNSSQGGGSKDTWVLARTAADLEADAEAESSEGLNLADITGRHRAISVDVETTV
jgi:hypothetical protein